MRLKFRTSHEVPDPLKIDGNVLTIGSVRFCTFTGLPTGECRCGDFAPDGCQEDPDEFVSYIEQARNDSASLFVRLRIPVEATSSF